MASGPPSALAWWLWPRLWSEAGQGAAPPSPSLHPAHVRSRVQPGICSWQSQQSAGSWQGVGSRHPPRCWIHPWIHQEEQQGSPLCFASLKSQMLQFCCLDEATRGFLAQDGCSKNPMGPSGQRGRWQLQKNGIYRLSIQLEPGEIFNQNFAKMAEPTLGGGAVGTKGHIEMCHHTAGETADTRRKGLKQAKKNIFAPSIPALPKQQGLSESQEFGGLWKFHCMREFCVPALESAT